MASLRTRSMATTETSVISPEITREFLSKLTSPDCSVRVIRLHDRPYTFKNIKKLCKALRKNTSVQVLDLMGTFIAEEFWRPDIDKQIQACKAIAGLLLHNRCIREFILDGNPISNPGASILAKAFAKSPLQRISLSVCDFESLNGIVEIVRSLYKSTTLESLKLNTSITLPVLQVAPFQLLNMYEKISTKMSVDTDIKNYFEMLQAERKLIFGKPAAAAAEEEVFPVYYTASPILPKAPSRTALPLIAESKRSTQTAEKKGPLSPGWSPTKFSLSAAMSGKNKFAEENKKNKAKKEEDRGFFSFGGIKR